MQWWHLYGLSIPDKWDVTVMVGPTSEGPEKAKGWKPKSEIDGAEMPYLASFEHRPTIAELNSVKIMRGLEPEVPADNVDAWGDALDDGSDFDLPF